MTGEVGRLALPARTAESRLIVVARAPRAEDYDAVLEVLVDAGIRSVELTLTTPGTFAAPPPPARTLRRRDRPRRRHRHEHR